MSLGFENIGSGGGGAENIDKFVYIPITDRQTILDLANKANLLIPYELLKGQSLWIVAVVSQPTGSNVEKYRFVAITKYKVKNLGSGFYGNAPAAIAILPENLEFISEQRPTTQNILQNPRTQVILLPELDAQTIFDYVNNANPTIVIQDQSIAPTLLKTPTESYLFLDNGGIYGIGGFNNTDATFYQTLEESILLPENFYPAPSLQKLAPNSLLPGTTTMLKINGSFFTPDTIVEIGKLVINSIIFINQGQLNLLVSIDKGSKEADLDITINNGKTVIFTGILPIRLGEVYIPEEEFFEDIIQPINIYEYGNVKFIIPGVIGSATWGEIIRFDYDWDFEWTYKRSSISPKSQGGSEIIFKGFFSKEYVFSIKTNDSIGDAQICFADDSSVTIDDPNYNMDNPMKFRLNYVDARLILYINDSLTYFFKDSKFDNYIKVDFSVSNIDITKIKYTVLTKVDNGPAL